MASNILFNSCIINPQHKHTQLLFLISSHPSFRTKVKDFYQVLNQNLTSASLAHLGALAFTLLLPEYPQKYLKQLAQEQIESIQSQEGRVTFNTLSQYLLKLCSYAVESIDVRSAIGFLDMLKSRITDTFIVDAKDPSKRIKVGIEYRLDIGQNESVLNDSGLAQKHHREEMKHIYYQQKVSLNEEELLKANEHTVVLTELKKDLNDVIPLGYICEDFIHQFSNGNFEVKHSYKLKKNRKLNFDRVNYMATSNEPTNNLIRDYTVNQEIFLTVAMLSQNHMPQEIHPPMTKSLPIARINQTFATKNYLQKLKLIASGDNKFFNILSLYFDRDQFDIDELELTREKLIMRRKESLLGIPSKESIKKELRNFDEEVLNFGLLVSRNMMKFYDEARITANIKELQANLRFIQEQDKNINNFIQKHMSMDDHIQRDNANPFFEDILMYAKMVPLQLLMIGRPKSGKSSLARAIAVKYNLALISFEKMVDNLFERVKFFEENPPEADEDGNIKDGLLLIEKYVLGQLQNGNAVEDEDMLDLLNNQLEKDLTKSRGYILDLPFEYNKFWIDVLVSNRLYLPKIQCRFFTHVIEIAQTQEQWKHFVSTIMEKPEDNTLTSGLDRYLLKKPKPPTEEGEQEQAQEDDGEKPPPLIESNLLEVKWKDSAFSLIEHVTQHMNPHRFIKVHNSYQSVAECLDLLEHNFYRIPLPKKIEGNEKQLLGVGLEELKIFRKWSPWGLIDCVQLSKGKQIAGKFQFAAQYAGRVFVFDNQNNLNSFLSLPRQHLLKFPALPKLTNLCITGPRKSGKKTIAKLLGDIYGLQVVNIQEIIECIIERQKQFETHIPSNFDKRSASVHLSEQEYKQFAKGNLLNAKDILPMVLYQIGVNLQKKPPGWGIQKNEDGEGGNAEPEEKKPAPKKPKKKDRNAEEERPKTPPPEDLSLKDIFPEINHFGKLNEIKGYIIIGYPNNEEQLNALKLFNIPIDKLIVLSDNSEQNPNKNLATRLNDAELEQVALFTAAIGPVKEAVGEQVCKEIMIDKSPEQIVNKIRQIIDPFYMKPDQDGLNRVIADKQEDGDPIPLGFSGQYCPVNLKNGWLIKGKEQFEAGIQGRRYRFAGEKQINDFKVQPAKYLNKSIPIIPPRIMLMGLRGVGLKTQLLKLNQKYRIPILGLKDTLLQQLENQKNKRKTERYYSKGFKKPEYDQDGKQIEDPELLEEAADFDRKNHEIQVIKNIFEGINEIFINGNFFDVEEDKVSTNIVQLLGQSRRLPEVVLMLTSDEQKWLERVLDRKVIEMELEQIKEKRRVEKVKEKQEARQKAIEAGEQYNQPAEEQEDTEVPKLEEMIAQKEESLKAQREADSAKLEEYTEAFKALGVDVITIKCEREVKHVTDRINYVIKPFIEDRINRWEKNNMLPIERHRAKDFLTHYIAADSRFGKLNPYTLIENPRPYPLIYNDRIYYFKDEEQRDNAMRNPKSLWQNEATPREVKSTPIIFIQGKTKSGKTTLAQKIKEKLGFKIIDIEELLSQFVKEHEDADIKAIVSEVKGGKCLSDESLVTLIEKRSGMSDCSRGWILDGLPLNKRQCELLNKKGIVPTLLLSLKMTELDIKKRVQKINEPEYDYYSEVVHHRLEATRKSLIEIEIYYTNKYNNVKVIEGHLSKWGIFEQARAEIQNKVKAKRIFIKDLITHAATEITHVGLSSNCIMHNLSDYLNFCPISYKIKREYIKVCLKNYENLALFNKKIYAFRSQKELQDFVKNPDTYTNKGEAFSPPEDIPLESIYNSQAKFENKGYGMVQLLKKNLVKGNYLYGVTYKGKCFLNSCPKNQKLFQRNPALYEMLKLPDKLPVEFEKKSDLKKIARAKDCSAFLEHHLSNIMMKSLAKLGYRRPKYPTLGSKESALKFLAINLKANNPNKDDQYRQKYTERLNRFIKESNYSQQIREEVDRKAKGPWDEEDEENLLKLCEEYSQFSKELDSTDKVTYFSNFIR